MDRDSLQQFETRELSRMSQGQAFWNHQPGYAIPGYGGTIPRKSAENVTSATWGVSNLIGRRLQASNKRPRDRQERQRLLRSALPTTINPQTKPYFDKWSNDAFKRLQSRFYSIQLTQDLQRLPTYSDDATSFDKVIMRNARVAKQPGPKRWKCRKALAAPEYRSYVCPAAYADKHGSAGVASFDIRLGVERQMTHNTLERFSPNQKESFGFRGSDWYVSKGNPRTIRYGI